MRPPQVYTRDDAASPADSISAAGWAASVFRMADLVGAQIERVVVQRPCPGAVEMVVDCDARDAPAMRERLIDADSNATLTTLGPWASLFHGDLAAIDAPKGNWLTAFETDGRRESVVMWLTAGST